MACLNEREAHPGVKRLRAALSASPAARQIPYTDEDWQDALIRRAEAAGFKYDGQTYWNASLTTAELLGLLAAQPASIDALAAAAAAQPKTNQCAETCERAKLCAVCAAPIAAKEATPSHVQDVMWEVFHYAKLMDGFDALEGDARAERREAVHAQDRKIRAMLAASEGAAKEAPAATAEPTRSQKLAAAGFTRRKGWKSLPSDDEPTDTERELPPLPRPKYIKVHKDSQGFEYWHEPFFDADQMREYVRAALTASIQPAPPEPTLNEQRAAVIHECADAISDISLKIALRDSSTQEQVLIDIGKFGVLEDARDAVLALLKVPRKSEAN